jgi:multiple sugar transport system substrate-binding protein
LVAVFTIYSKLENKPPREIIESNNNALVFAHYWQDKNQKAQIRLLADEFEKQNADTKVVLRDYSYAQMRDMFLSATEADTADKTTRDFFSSDVFTVDPRWLYEAIRNSRLEPLTPYMENSGFSPSLQGASLQASLQGDPAQDDPASAFESWAIPLTSNINILFYNINVLKAVGFDRPPKSWKDFNAYARVLTTPGKYGISFSGAADSSYPEIYPWIWAAGVKMLDNGKPAFESKGIADVLIFFSKLNQDGLVSPGAFSKSKEQKFKEFTSSKVGMMVASVEDIEAIRKEMGDTSFGISTIPVPDNFSGKPVFGVTGTSIGIGSLSKHKETAWAFISYLSEHSPAISKAIHSIPGNGNTPSLDSLEGNPFFAKAYNMYEGADVVQEFTGIRRVRRLDAAVRDALLAMYAGASVEDTARTIQSLWEEALGE